MNNSMTEDDLDYAIRLDEDSVELTESRTSHHDSSSETIRTLKGRWEPLRVTTENVALRLSGVDGHGKAAERFLVLWDDDTDCGDLAWWAKASRQMDDRTVTLEPASAVARGLPPLRIRVCYDRLPFLVQTFPTPGPTSPFPALPAARSSSASTRFRRRSATTRPWKRS